MTPVAPGVKQAVCAGGVVTPAQPTLPESTAEITYSSAVIEEVDEDEFDESGQGPCGSGTRRDSGAGDGDVGPDRRGLAGGVAAGWTRTSDPRTATYTVTFNAVACTPVEP